MGRRICCSRILSSSNYCTFLDASISSSEPTIGSGGCLLIYRPIKRLHLYRYQRNTRSISIGCPKWNVILSRTRIHQRRLHNLREHGWVLLWQHQREGKFCCPTWLATRTTLPTHLARNWKNCFIIPLPSWIAIPTYRIIIKVCHSIGNCRRISWVDIYISHSTAGRIFFHIINVLQISSRRQQQQ